MLQALRENLQKELNIFVPWRAKITYIFQNWHHNSLGKISTLL